MGATDRARVEVPAAPGGRSTPGSDAFRFVPGTPPAEVPTTRGETQSRQTREKRGVRARFVSRDPPRPLGGETKEKRAANKLSPGGAPPHQDMWDIKTEAPADVKGEFKPIATAVPGVQIGEVFQRIAARMDKFAVIRSLVGARGGHDALQCMAGWEG